MEMDQNIQTSNWYLEGDSVGKQDGKLSQNAFSVCPISTEAAGHVSWICYQLPDSERAWSFSPRRSMHDTWIFLGYGINNIHE